MPSATAIWWAKSFLSGVTRGLRETVRNPSSAVDAFLKRQELAKKEERLSAPEIRFLRTYLGYSSKDLAAFLAVAPETMSRWETAALQMSLSMERLLRFMALTDKPISDYGLDNAGTKDQTTKKPHFKQRSGSWSEA